MLNFRTLKHDFAPAILRDGKLLFEKNMVLSAKIVNLTSETIRISAKILGNFDHCYESEIEICRHQSTIIDSDCDCPYKYDCQHLAALLFYLEPHYNEILVIYSKEADIDNSSYEDEIEKKQLKETLKEAENKEQVRQNKKQQKELLQEYIHASQMLGQSPFFHSNENLLQDKAELALIFTPPQNKNGEQIEIQLALRLPFRSKSLNIFDIRTFLEGIAYNEPIYIAGKRYFFSMNSFDNCGRLILKTLIDFARIGEGKNDKQPRSAFIDKETFGNLLGAASDAAKTNLHSSHQLGIAEENGFSTVPYIYCGSLEEPLKLSTSAAKLNFELDYLKHPAPKILLKAAIITGDGQIVPFEDALIFESTKSGIIHLNTYYPFQSILKRRHLRSLASIRDMTIPEPLFGTFVENALPELMRYVEVTNREAIEKFVTLPFVAELKAACTIQYLDGELEASLTFIYDDIRVPAAPSQLRIEEVNSFITNQGILARNLIEEQKIISSLFQDFLYDSQTGVYKAKNEKKIVEFMTEILPAHQHRVFFDCPENLLDQFIYDDSSFHLVLKESSRIDMYEVQLEVSGHLNGVPLDVLWDCILMKKAFIELASSKGRKKKSSLSTTQTHAKILVLDLDKLASIVHLFDEIGIARLDNHIELRPLWSLASLDPDLFKDLPVYLELSPKLQEIQKQILGQLPCAIREVPSIVQASLRNYQTEGVQWLDRLRQMHLNGILADDMGLGKTLQAIIVLTQFNLDHPDSCSIVISPTSLVYNWKEEFAKFNPHLKTLAVDGTPTQRKKLLEGIGEFDVIITSYTLLQKDVDFYKSIPFGYAILDEAQHIKNRTTRNAQSVKMIQAAHKLILTGTPIENALDELWSLFDFLMPGLLSSYDRFVEKYIRHFSPSLPGKHLEGLRRKVAPFILRRMKKDVLDDLPPVSEITYYCHLSDVQKSLYSSYAASAREELSQLVKKEGFDRVQIHVLATLTRLKQICCHPAIFAKDKAEPGDSAKYDMLLELLQTLNAGGHKTVIFSQYTKMLGIIREDLQKQGIPFEYLDGSTKNRLSIVKNFNEDQNIPIFLVSLKAGGSGLNLTGAQFVVHYDLWWNPAVKNQATDRVHRMGQKHSVSSYELITRNTIEEKIVELHNRKKGLVKEVVSWGEDMMAKLTWEEVLQLLQAPV